MNETKRFASLIGGIGLVVASLAWFTLRDNLIAGVSTGISVSLLLHGIAWLVLIGGISLIAAASTAKRPQRHTGTRRSRRKDAADSQR